MAESRLYRIGEAIVEIWPDFMRTTYTLDIPAAGNTDAESIRRAWQLGYAGNTTRMSIEHELLHSLIAEQRGEPFSRVLLGVGLRAIGGNKEDVISKQDSDAEEGLVLDIQKYAMRGLMTPRLTQSGLDVDAVVARLREILG